ncbi:MAG: hypothetical protein IKI11_04710, partial [Neisseriaceae bacterium]|nr:hypothetical protein [Neisseriaceae bacterium]
MIKLTVKEFANKGDRRIYTIEDIDLEENNGSVHFLTDADAVKGLKSDMFHTADIESLIQNIQDFNNGVANTIPNNKRFSLASNNKAIERMNANALQWLKDRHDLSMLRDEFLDDDYGNFRKNSHKVIFDRIEKANTLQEVQEQIKKLEKSLLNNEIEHSEDIYATFRRLFREIAGLQNLKQYSEDDLRRIADNANFKKWFAKAHKFFRNEDGTPKVFYRGLSYIYREVSDAKELQTNASGNRYSAEYYTDNAEVAYTYRLVDYDSYTQQVALNAQKPFIVPYIEQYIEKDWNDLLGGYTGNQAVRLFKMAGFDTKPANWDSLKVEKVDLYGDTSLKTPDDAHHFFLQTGDETGVELIADKELHPAIGEGFFNAAFNRNSEKNAIGTFTTNFFVRNLQQRGKFDSVVFQNIYDNGGRNKLAKKDETSTVVAVWGTPDNQAYAKELGNKGTFSKEDKRIFYSLKNNQGATQSEFDATAKQYGGEKAYNQAKADGKTALTYKQWVQVRTPSFKAWFGDWENDPENASKVVNPDTGEPLVVYHGTEQVFTKFDITKSGENTGDSGFYGTGFYFADKKYIAEQYGKNITQFFLNIRKIFNADDFDNSKYSNLFSLEELGFPKGYTLADLNNELDTLKDSDRVSIGYEVVGKYSDGSDRYLLYVTVDGKDVTNEYVSKNYIDSVKENNFNKHRIQGAVYILENKYPNAKIKSDYQIWDFGSYAVREILINNGFDGVIGGGTNAFDIGNEIVAFYPNQIKSATENKGSFDGSNPDIRYSLKNQPTIKEQIRENADKLNNMPSVASVTGTAKNITALRQEVLQHLKDTGGFVVDVPNFGKVELGEKEISQSLKYIETDAEKIAYKAIKAVLKRGIRIENRNNHKDRNYSPVTFAAPIEINGV